MNGGTCCGNCAFWRAVEVDACGWGACHRFPPHRSEHEEFPEGGVANVGRWPDTAESDWCGEWRRSAVTADWDAFHADLSARLRKVFLRAGVRSFDDLARLTVADLRRVKPFGVAVEIELRQRLQDIRANPMAEN